MTAMWRILFTFSFLSTLLWMLTPLAAGIYKYQQNGVWHYTDTPPADLPAGSQEMEESGVRVPDDPTTGPDSPLLLADFPARNAIEQAAACTVAVKSAIGYGSGFFISSTGYIITNRHVVRGSADQAAKNESWFKEVETRIAALDRQLDEENLRIRNFKSRLDRLKKAAENETQPERRRAYREDYEENLKTYQNWQADYDKRCDALAGQKKKFRDGRQDYDYDTSIAALARSFTIVLADSSEQYARLVKVSQNHDLALLKLDGYRTPALKAGAAGRLAQGDPVYAVGNPARLQNSVTSGIFSGFEQGFVKTNAQIYPGNSGGPLVTTEGRVLGINTFKKLTHKFEGLGFAIPIETALSEFAAYLPPQ